MQTPGRGRRTRQARSMPLYLRSSASEKRSGSTMTSVRIAASCLALSASAPNPRARGDQTLRPAATPALWDPLAARSGAGSRPWGPAGLAQGTARPGPENPPACPSAATITSPASPTPLAPAMLHPMSYLWTGFSSAFSEGFCAAVSHHGSPPYDGRSGSAGVSRRARHGLSRSVAAAEHGRAVERSGAGGFGGLPGLQVRDVLRSLSPACGALRSRLRPNFACPNSEAVVLA